ncbi:hypothetical protein HCU74_05550 [Spongiibacter sp. KMU-166]|uniref:Uncharacterized protein n=1 Tax=Spongiibacter thalassae TaxID=2721624 RepID=A0ABX1GFA0_9GAMM|nr:hypothetical protein [Spongiibacter thalassae]NKI16884.1 hypothetical protein [Spongiibacter thalassae]
MERLKKACIPVFVFCVIASYLCAMVFSPLLSAGFDWEYLQRVWDRWQTLNAAMIALCASLVALWASQRQASLQKKLIEDQREREFVAARAFLSAALAELQDYLRDVYIAYSELYEELPVDGSFSDDNSYVPDVALPELPVSHRTVFRDCITHASPDIAKYLSHILSRVQVINSRVMGINESIMYKSRSKIVDDILSVAEIEATCNKLYSFARGDSPLIPSPIGDDDLIGMLHRATCFWEKQKMPSGAITEAIRILSNKIAE